MMAAWEAARELLAARLRARGRFWRAKALDLGSHPDTCLTRAEEAEACAEVAGHLAPSYAAPAEPDMASARKSRGP